jgi:hypothetical protein
MISLIESCCLKGSYWTKCSYCLSWSHDLINQYDHGYVPFVVFFNHNQNLSLFITYHRVCNKINSICRYFRTVCIVWIPYRIVSCMERKGVRSLEPLSWPICLFACLMMFNATFSVDQLTWSQPSSLNNWISNGNSYINKKAVIVWSLDLQLTMQSVPLTIDVVSSNLDQD